MIVVTDTSVILNLCWLQRASFLQDLFHRVLAPLVVQQEFERLARADSRFAGLVFPKFVELVDPKEIPLRLTTNPKLQAGEIAALALALEYGADLVLLDEKAARAVAEDLGLTVFGLLAVLLGARQAGLVAEIRPLIDRLIHEARFRIKPALRERVLTLAGEY